MNQRVDQRLEALQALRTDDPFDPERFAASLEVACQETLPRLTGDPDLDIVRVSLFRGDGETGSDYELEGYAEGGTRRLWCAFDDRDGGVEAYVALTQRNREASCLLFGMNGSDIGNPILLARIFDLTLDAALTCGLQEIRSQPSTPVLRRLYRRMGFENGERFVLSSPSSLLRALLYIESAYHGPSRYPTFAPPW